MQSLPEIGLSINQLIEHISDLTIITDTDGQITTCNQAWLNFLGLDEDEAHNMRLSQIIAQEELGVFQNIWDSLRQGQIIAHHVFTVVRADGNTASIIGSLIPNINSARTFSGVFGLFHPHHLPNEEIRSRSAALSNLSDAVIASDMDMHVLGWNHIAESVYGWRMSDIFGKRLPEIVHTRYVGTTQEAFQNALLEHGSWSGELIQTHQNGTRLYMHSTASVVKDAGGNAIGIVTVNRDISERKKIDTELRLLNKAIESSNSAITIADANQPDMPLVYVNPAFERITGYPESEILGRNCRFLQADDRDQPEIQIIREALANHRACVVTLRNYRKNGGLFWNELRITPMQDEHGVTTHFVGVSTDITDRKLAEERIKTQNDALIRANRALAEARAQAEAATRLKSEFLATMSHELRTPLNAIIGYTEIQLAGMTGEINDEQREYLERVLTNAEHLLSLINDVLDLSKIEAGRVELVRKPFNLPELLEEIVNHTRGLAEKKGLEFNSNLDQRLPEILVGDPARIKQIAINLLSNAIKFTDTGYVKIDMRQHGPDAWTLVVSDTGIGIPAHQLETIFEEFRQIDGTSQRKHGGTGLGLSIVRKLAIMMGGSIRVRSEVDRGSAFTVFLPIAQPREEF